MATNQMSDEANELLRNAAQELQQDSAPPEAKAVEPPHVETGEGKKAVSKPNGEKPSRQPKKLIVTKIHKKSRHFVTLTVLDAIENGVGIPGCTVRAMDRDSDPPVVDLPATNSLGVTRFEYELLNHRDAQVKLIILGTDITKQILLRKET